MVDDRHKTFTLSVDLLLTIVLLISIGATIWMYSLSNKITILQENQGYLQDHDSEMQKLKQNLFVDILKGE